MVFERMEKIKDVEEYKKCPASIAGYFYFLWEESSLENVSISFSIIIFFYVYVKTRLQINARI